MFSGHDQILYELLALQQRAEPAALRDAFAAHEAEGQPFATVLVNRGVLDRPALLGAVAEHLGCTWVGALPVQLPEDLRDSLKAGLARTLGVAPIASEHGVVTVVAVNPFNPDLAADLTFALGRAVRLAVADPDLVARFIERYFGERQPPSDEESAAARPEVRDETALSAAELAEMAGQTSIIHLVNLVLAQAVRAKSSDVHFEPFEHEFKIRYRIDGTLYEMSPPPKNLALPIISRLKVLANLNIAERRRPQDGRIKLALGERTVDLRISTLPTQFGESVVLRVLDQSSGQFQLNQLGLPAAIEAGLETVLRRPNGILLVTGPTGSGKTTTLYGCLKLLNTIEVKMLTVEDPVEYELDGVMQVPVNPAAGLNFARALRTFLRQDPDIVMVGEIRDVESAQIAIQAALTGHLVLSTLHTNDAPSAVTRLVDMGLEPFLLASTVEAVLAQRLVRRICPSCKVAATPPEALLRQLGLAPFAGDRPFYTGAGCAQCHQTGFRGRLGLFEFLRMTDPLRELVMQRASLVEFRQRAAGAGLTTLRDAGLRAIFAGETTVEEVVKFT